ncbi:MAG: hypothetical protein M3Z04_21905, partial [Chloroflexota bacterium]|nr:hypothetical protein [Chloroflexota bacterium]
MMQDPLPEDIERLAAGQYSEVTPVGQPGTSGSVFRALDRKTNRLVAIKVSHGEDSAKGSLLAEDAALSEPRIAEVAEPGAAPTARRRVGRLDPFGRVGLVLEWLDDSYTSVEKLVREGDIRFTELQALRILAPLTHLLAEAHRAGYLYVDIDAQKADHLWWKVSRDEAGSVPTYQLKVIDWANAIRMTDPSYVGDVTPAHDIAGVGQLLFYMVHGPNVALPDSPTAAALQERTPLNDLVRRAMFLDAEGSFVRQVRDPLTAAQRAGMWRDADLRARATKSLDEAVRGRRDALAGQQQALLHTIQSTVDSLEAAARMGLPALNRAVDAAAAHLGVKAEGDSRAQTTGLIKKVEELSERAARLDPEGADTRPLQERLNRLLVERANVEQMRRLLAQADTSERLDSALKRTETPTGEPALMSADVTLLAALTGALKEAAATPGGLNRTTEAATLPGLIDSLLAGTPDVVPAVRGLTRWGEGPAVHAFRLAAGRRAGAPLLREEVADLLTRMEAMRRESEQDAAIADQSESSRNRARAALRLLTERIAALRQARDGLVAREGEPVLPLLTTVRGVYDTLATAVTNALVVEGLHAPGGPATAAALDAIRDALATAESALDEGNLGEAVTALQTWATRDPESSLAGRYADLVARYPGLDRAALLAHLETAGLSDLDTLIGTLPAALTDLQTVAPRSTYRAALKPLFAALNPLVEHVLRATASAPPSGGAADESRAFAVAVGAGLPGVLAAALRSDPPAPGRLPAATHRLVAAPATADLSKKPVLYYEQVAGWLPPRPAGFVLTSGDMRENGLPALRDGLDAIEAGLPAFAPVTAVYRQWAARVCDNEAAATLGQGDLDGGAAWYEARLLAASSPAAASAAKAARALAEAEGRWNRVGPVAAGNALAALDGDPAWQSPPFGPPLQAARDTLHSALAVQNQALTVAQAGFQAVQNQQGRAAAEGLNQALAEFGSATDHADSTLGGAPAGSLPRRLLRQDLEPLMRIWGETLPPTRQTPVDPAVYQGLAAGLQKVAQAAIANGHGKAATLVRGEVASAVYLPLAAALLHVAAQQIPPDPAGSPPYG